MSDDTLSPEDPADPPRLAPDLVAQLLEQEVFERLTGETRAFSDHYVMGVRILRADLDANAADLSEADRAAAFAAGCWHLAEPIRRDIDRLQRDEPDQAPGSQRWTERVATLASDQGTGK